MELEVNRQPTETRAEHILVFGASGTIGAALITQLSKTCPTAHIHGISRQALSGNTNLANVTFYTCDYGSEHSLAKFSQMYSEQHSCVDQLLIASGVLTAVLDEPEKSVKQITEAELLENFRINAIIPALIFKYFFDLLNRAPAPRFGTLSARIGSISDNRLGGWYSYRMAKSALNMFIKTASLELKRKNKQSIVVGLHPGTVKTKFSERFINNITKNCFTSEVAASQLIEVFTELTPSQSGGCFAWDGTEIQP